MGVFRDDLSFAKPSTCPQELTCGNLCTELVAVWAGVFSDDPSLAKPSTVPPRAGVWEPGHRAGGSVGVSFPWWPMWRVGTWEGQERRQGQIVKADQ